MKKILLLVCVVACLCLIFDISTVNFSFSFLKKDKGEVNSKAEVNSSEVPLAAIGAGASAEQTVNPYSTESAPLQPEHPPTDSDDGWYTQWVRVSHTEGKGIGYPCGFTSLQLLFGPEYVGGQVLPLLDVGFHYFNDNTTAGNVGFIARYIPTVSNWLPGLNVYYDFRTINSQYFNELGLGVEVLGKRLDFFANGYLPIGHMTQKAHTHRHNYPGGYFVKFSTYRTILGGLDAGMGIILLQKAGFQIYTSGGPYLLTGRRTAPFWGGSLLLETDYKDIIAVTLSGSHDSHFGTIFQIQVSLSWPLYKDPKVDPPASTRQVYQPIQRKPVFPMRGPHCNCCWDSNF